MFLNNNNNILQINSIQILKRNYSEDFIRSKPHCNIGTIGHVDHGKTTLTSAITKVLSKKGFAKYVAYEQIDKHPEEASRKITINSSHVEYETDNRHYSHIDCPGHQQYIKNMITGAAQMEGAILVVAATEGVQLQTREHVLLAREIGIKHLVVFLNKVDAVKEADLVEFAELEVRELLNEYLFPGDDIPVIAGSARMALDDDPESVLKIEELMENVDTFIKEPPRLVDKPFLMPIKESFKITGRGSVLSGNVEQGQVKIGEDLELKGDRMSSITTCIGIEMFKKRLDSARAGENVGILARGIAADSVKRGFVLAKPGSVTCTNYFSAKIYILTKEEGGRSSPFLPSYRPHFFIRTGDVSGVFEFPEDTTVINPGDNLELRILTQFTFVLSPGLRFTFREGGKTIGAGVINEVFNEKRVT